MLEEGKPNGVSRNIGEQDSTLLVEAIRAGNLSIALDILKQGTTESLKDIINAKDSNGLTLLMLAIKFKGDNFSLIKLLIEKGAKVDREALDIARRQYRTGLIWRIVGAGVGIAICVGIAAVALYFFAPVVVGFMPWAEAVMRMLLLVPNAGTPTGLINLFAGLFGGTLFVTLGALGIAATGAAIIALPVSGIVMAYNAFTDFFSGRSKVIVDMLTKHYNSDIEKIAAEPPTSEIKEAQRFQVEANPKSTSVSRAGSRSYSDFLGTFQSNPVAQPGKKVSEEKSKEVQKEVTTDTLETSAGRSHKFTPPLSTKQTSAEEVINPPLNTIR